MNLYTYCKSCKKDIKIKSQADTRHDLQMEKGREFKVNCLSCGSIEKKHVNDVKAEVNNKIIYFGIGLGVVATITLLYFYGAIGTLSGLIPILFWRQQMSSIKSFNSFMVKR
ncbi:hypothetical protein [Aquimarina pacifica]|uniref:hypothetical protein n=1 Tax=Aquimarina pacifica TaxID=1296415 RepID=UPI00046F3FEE|nr:hypothetical protein [Aquimarina pacifica]